MKGCLKIFAICASIALIGTVVLVGGIWFLVHTKDKPESVAEAPAVPARAPVQQQKPVEISEDQRQRRIDAFFRGEPVEPLPTTPVAGPDVTEDVEVVEAVEATPVAPTPSKGFSLGALLTSATAMLILGVLLAGGVGIALVVLLVKKIGQWIGDMLDWTEDAFTNLTFLLIHAPILLTCALMHSITNWNSGASRIENFLKHGIATRSARFVYEHKDELSPKLLVKFCCWIVVKLGIDANADGAIDVDAANVGGPGLPPGTPPPMPANP